MQRTLVIIGAMILVIGLLWPWISRIGFGRLPGDFTFSLGGVKVYAPLATSIVLSVVLTLLLRLFNR